MKKVTRVDFDKRKHVKTVNQWHKYLGKKKLVQVIYEHVGDYETTVFGGVLGQPLRPIGTYQTPIIRKKVIHHPIAA